MNLKQSEGILKQIPKIFYTNHAINYKALCILTSSFCFGVYCLKSFIKSNKKNRVSFKKWYYRTHANALQYINLLVRVHLPLSINSIVIISHLRYLKHRNIPLDYNDIKSGYVYGLLNFVMTAFIISKITDAYLYQSVSSDTTIKMFERFILSPAQQQLATRMHQTNQLLEERLSSGVDDINGLVNIIWQYIGPPSDAVDYTEFEEVTNYVQVLKNKFISEQKQFVLAEYLLRRAMSMFDISAVTKHPFWKLLDKYEAGADIKGVIAFIRFVAQLNVYIARLFAKMTMSQIWYLIILEMSGNHDLLVQYLYSLMGREPLYLIIGLPFFILRFTPIRADRFSAILKDWIIYNEKEITKTLFGAEGFVQSKNVDWKLSVAS